jgi:sarcosine oxidase delta subunit
VTHQHDPLVSSSRISIRHILPEADSKIPREEEEGSSDNISQYLCNSSRDNENGPVKHLWRLFSSCIKIPDFEESRLELIHQG